MHIHWMCETCGTQFEASANHPHACPICLDERQYVGTNGQRWTTLEELINSNTYHNHMEQEEAHVFSITTRPSFAIGQTAHLIQTPHGNMLWDCISYLDQETIQTIEKLGGIDWIALSHPHYYSTQVEWAERFRAPIYIHEDDREWVMRSSKWIHFWSGEQLELSSGLTIHRLGGHFKGGSVLHWSDGADGKGALFTGDIIQVVADTNWVSFMYSYPNLIPLPAAKVKDIADKVKPLAYDKIYGAFHRQVYPHADQVVQRSAERYIRALNDELLHKL